MVDLHRKQEVGPKVDVWAMGCLLFHLCFRDHPFEAEASLQILNAKYTIPSGSPYSESMHDLIRRMLTPDPTERPSAAEMLATVRQMRSRHSRPRATLSDGSGGVDRPTPTPIPAGDRPKTTLQPATARPAPPARPKPPPPLAQRPTPPRAVPKPAAAVPATPPAERWAASDTFDASPFAPSPIAAVVASSARVATPFPAAAPADVDLGALTPAALRRLVMPPVPVGFDLDKWRGELEQRERVERRLRTESRGGGAAEAGAGAKEEAQARTQAQAQAQAQAQSEAQAQAEPRAEVEPQAQVEAERTGGNDAGAPGMDASTSDGVATALSWV